MRAVEDHVVVELGIAGQTDRTPVFNQRLDSQCRGYRRREGPGGSQASVQRNGVEDLDVGPSLMTKPSTISTLSSSAKAWATPGKYQPGGGGGRRVRVRPSRAPRRPRMRLMVRTEGVWATPSSQRAWRMASAPTAPRSPWARFLRVCNTRSSKVGAVRRVVCGARERSDQSTRSSRWPLARWAQWATVATPTPNFLATARSDWPRRTAATMARRRSV